MSIRAITDLPREAKHIEHALFDIATICKKKKIRYRIFGSTAIIAATGELYRIPNDVDILIDHEKEDIFEKELIRYGYKKRIPGNIFDTVFKKPLTQYRKHKAIIEPRTAIFSTNGIFCPVSVPIPFVSEQKRPKLTIRFSKTMSETRRYTFGTVSFFSLNPEALYIALLSFMPLMTAVDEDTERRKKDITIIQNVINKMKLKQILDEKPGIYYKAIPLSIPSKNYLIDTVAFLMRFRKK